MSVESSTACKEVLSDDEIGEDPPLVPSSLMGCLTRQQKELLLQQLEQLKQDLDLEKFMPTKVEKSDHEKLGKFLFFTNPLLK